jgi:glycosyltransferase involved in cell wall biosynthesis
MSLTIVIPTRNRKILLKKLLNNLLMNFKQIDQIVIVDSSDKAESKAKFLVNKKVLYVHSEIKSAAIQRNIGLSFVQPNCRYIAFLDDDVSPPSNYFTDLIALLKNRKAAGVSGVAENLNIHKSEKNQKLFEAYRKFFFLDSNQEGVVLNSGVNIPVKNTLNTNPILECKWLIGCAVWDYQKIKRHQFDNRFYGQSLGEDVLFSLQASKYGKLYVKRNLVLKHFESPIGRPNYLNHNRMWVRNRYYISKELLGNRLKISYHWCNFGKFLSILMFAPKHPINFILGSIGMYLGFLDVIKGKYAS